MELFIMALTLWVAALQPNVPPDLREEAISVAKYAIELSGHPGFTPELTTKPIMTSEQQEASSTSPGLPGSATGQNNEPRLELQVTFGQPADEHSDTPYTVVASFSPIPEEPVSFSLEAGGAQLDSGNTSMRSGYIYEQDGKWFYTKTGMVKDPSGFKMTVGSVEKEI